MNDSLDTEQGPRAALFGRYDGEEGGDLPPVTVMRGGRVDPENPDHWPWNVRARGYTSPAASEAQGMCPGWGCQNESMDVRSSTPTALRPFCSACRRCASSALFRGTVTPSKVGEWLRNPRKVGRPAGAAR